MNKPLRFSAALLLILAVAFFPAAPQQAVAEDGPYVTAHRGSSVLAPENTMAAIRQAMADGAHIVEIDVQMTQDGVVILYHDETLLKLGLPGRVPDTPYSVIAAADAGSWHSPAHAGEPVPVLEQVLEATRGKIRLNIELKMTAPSLPLPETVAALVDDYGMTESTIITSFDREALRRAKAANPALRTGLIIKKKSDLNEDVWTDDLEMLSLKSNLVNRDLVDKARRSGKEVHVWTVNSKKEMKRLIGLGVSGIITDRPDALVALLD
jgi:glycerophosphoryl diester phosphodiesterase